MSEPMHPDQTSELDLAEIRRFASGALGTEAVKARLLELYDELSGDAARYEVETPKGACQVIRSRMGGLTVFPTR